MKPANDETRKARLQDFFTRYATLFNRALEGKPDLELTTQSFATCFIGANPTGVACGNNDAQLRTTIAQGYLFYKNIGVTIMDILSCETTLLDDFHEMTRTQWRCSFTRKDETQGEIVFENIYFTQTLEDAPKIFAYITGDEQAALKKNGLI